MKKFKLKSGNIPKFKQMGSSPLKTHDGTKSSTTHYADGSPKSKREIEFSKRHETEITKESSDYERRKEALLNKGFTQKDADWMIKHGGDTDPEPAAEHPKYKKKSPTKWVAAAIKLAPMVMSAAQSMKKKKEE